MSFENMVAEAASIADDVWAEPITIKPYRAGSIRERAGADPDRAEFETKGVIQTRSKAPRRHVAWATDVDHDHVILFIRHANMPPYPIDDGDYVHSPGPRVWRVVGVNTQAHDRAELQLSPVRGIDE
ncbi:hypothetical protein ATO13_22591 [Stappia sp. 22II-S9-Z10]|nr:hypothetical protein ATO13_22591 [Stappia sp. 22II-S9-Z10]